MTFFKQSIQNFKKILQVLRLTDNQSRLSLTNIFLIGSIAYVLGAETVSVYTYIPLLVGFLSYNIKRFTESKMDMEKMDKLQQDVGDLQSKVTALVMSSQSRIPRRR